MDSMLLAEAAELRGQCSQGIFETPLGDFNGLLMTSDLDYFQNGVRNARKVWPVCLTYMRPLYSL